MKITLEAMNQSQRNAVARIARRQGLTAEALLKNATAILAGRGHGKRKAQPAYL